MLREAIRFGIDPILGLVPGVPETLMTLRMGISDDGAWTARLRVEPTS